MPSMLGSEAGAASRPPASLAEDGSGLVILHEQIGELGGSERVLAAVVDRYPAATLLGPRFDGTNLPDGYVPQVFEHVSEWEWNCRRRHFLTPLYAWRLGRHRLPPTKVVLTLAHTGYGFAARVPAGARHVCYTAGLPRYLYGHTDRYLLDYPRALRGALRATTPALRAHGRRMMRLPDRLLTNSRCSAEAIERVVGRSADVVFPPVRTEFFTPAERPREHVLAVARLVPHKRIDVLVEAFRGLDAQLVVAGGGPWLERLRADAPANVRFTGWVDDEELRELYRRSWALAHPVVEEFGIVMAEAQAIGVPVIAPRAGGAVEIVRDGETGLLLDRTDPDSIAAAVRRLQARPFDPAACRAAAEPFAESRFCTAIERVVEQELRRAEAPSANGARGAPEPAGQPVT